MASRQACATPADINLRCGHARHEVSQMQLILSDDGMSSRDIMLTPSPEMLARQKRTWLLACLGMGLSVLIYGANFAISRHGLLNGLSNHDMLALRFATAGTLLLPVFFAGGFPTALKTCAGIGWPRGLALVMMSGFPMSYLMITGLTLAPAAHGATIGPGTVTVIGVLGSVLLFGTIITRNLVAGIAMVLAGLGTLGWYGSANASTGVIWGDLCFLGVGLVWGGYPLAIQFWKLDGLKATAIVSVVSMAYLPIYALFYFRGFDFAPWWVILLHAINQGVLNVIVGLWIWAWAARVLGASVVGRFPPLIPVVGTLMAIPVLGEIPGTLQIAAIMLIVSGLWLTTWRPGNKATNI
jgi:drug/metabolite transporter (DMT)-like permease